MKEFAHMLNGAHLSCTPPPTHPPATVASAALRLLVTVHAAASLHCKINRDWEQLPVICSEVRARLSPSSCLHRVASLNQDNSLGKKQKTWLSADIAAISTCTSAWHSLKKRRQRLQHPSGSAETKTRTIKELKGTQSERNGPGPKPPPFLW